MTFPHLPEDCVYRGTEKVGPPKLSLPTSSSSAAGGGGRHRFSGGSGVTQPSTLLSHGVMAPFISKHKPAASLCACVGDLAPPGPPRRDMMSPLPSLLPTTCRAEPIPCPPGLLPGAGVRVESAAGPGHGPWSPERHRCAIPTLKKCPPRVLDTGDRHAHTLECCRGGGGVVRARFGGSDPTDPAGAQ